MSSVAEQGNNGEQPRTLLVVTTTFPRWQNDAAPPFVYELSRRLTDRFDVTVHTPHYPSAKTREQLENISVNRFRYFFGKYEKLAGQTAIIPTLRQNKAYFLLIPFFLIAQFTSLFLLIRKVKPDVIHAHWLIPTGFLAVLCSRLTLKSPVLITCHGADVFGLRGRFFATIKRWTLKNVHGVSAVSSALKCELVNLGGSTRKIEVLPMGVCPETFNPAKYSADLAERLKIKGTFLLFVGRLTEKKGVRYLLEAIKILDKRQLPLTLVIVGHGEQALWLHDYSRRLGIEQMVRFAGAIPNEALPPYYATADIFIGPSIQTSGGDREGFGLTFVEAAFSGCILVGSDIGGTADIFECCRPSFLAEPENAQDLAVKIGSAIEIAGKNRDEASLCRDALIARFEWNEISSRYKSLLNNLYQAGSR
jgi:glycosyltransferase involved in cell wall biosynthesis